MDLNGAALGTVIRAVANVTEGAVVVHCTAGKDRSGIASALIQLAVGVDGAEVLADYALTRANLDGEWAAMMRRKMRRFRMELTPELERVLVGSPPEALAETLAHIDAAHVGIDAYLAKIGVTNSHRAQLVEQLAP